MQDVRIRNILNKGQEAASHAAQLNSSLVLTRLIEIQAGQRDGQAVRALELLGKHLGLFPDRVSVDDPKALPREKVAEKVRELRRTLKLG